MSDWDFHVDGLDHLGHGAADGYADDLAATDHASLDPHLDSHFDSHLEAHDEVHHDVHQDDVHQDDVHHDGPPLDDIHFGDDFTGHYDLAGADPDEQGLWDQLMLDLSDEVNPYVTN